MIRVSSAVFTVRTYVYGFAFVLALAPAARAQQDVSFPPAQQEVTGPPPAYIALVDGAATVERDGQSQPAALNAPFVPGDRLRTTTGRVEVLFPDGTALDVDQYSSVDLQSETLIRLLSGRLMLVVAGASDPASAVRYQVDTPAASARMDGAGEYRVAVLNGRSGVETELAVLRGSAALATERGSMPIHAGERTVARAEEAPAFPQAFNSARFDAFDEWSLQQQSARTSTASAQYLPQDLQMYGGTLDRSGGWEYTAPYGYAWYPTVAPDWRPYYHGSWAAYQPWGWTWIGTDVWSWPTHHYGRWGFSGSRWFWVPGRTWAPAWVSWGSAPGYVSWCPLGFNGRPVFSLSLGFGHAWSGWTVVPRTSFGHLARVDRFALPPQRIPVLSTAFVTHRAAPVAVPQTAHVVNMPHRGGVQGRPSIVDSRQSGVGGGSSGVAVPRAGEFKQPLPDGFRARERTGSNSAPVQRAEPRGATPAPSSATPTAAPRGAYPHSNPSTASPNTAPQGSASRRAVAPGNATSGSASPRNANPGTANQPPATQAPPAAPRAYPQPAEHPQRASPSSAPPPPPPARERERERRSAPAADAPPPARATERPASAAPQSSKPSSGSTSHSSGGSSRSGSGSSHSSGGASHGRGRGGS